MSWFCRKGPYDIDNRALDRASRRAPRRAVTKETKKLTLLLFLNTLLALLVYFTCVSLHFAQIFFLYLGGVAVLLIVYVIYNRGFVLRGATPDMLSDEYSPDQKQAMLDEATRRMSDSRWMLILIIPLVLAMLLDVIYLFLLEDLLISFGMQL